MDYSKYTERQNSIVKGEIPLSKAATFELERLFEKAMYRVDKEAIDLVCSELRRRKVRFIHSEVYGEKQQKIVSGEISLYEVESKVLKQLMRVARFRGDKKIVEEIEEEIRRRGTPCYIISGYSVGASALIQGMQQIEEAPYSGVVWLAKKAHELADTDVAEWADAELRRRGSSCDTSSDMSRVKPDQLKKANSWELAVIMSEARINDDQDLLKKAEAEIEKRSTEARTVKYTEKERAIISGKIPAKEARTWELRTLLEKLRRDDPDMESVAALIQVEYEQLMETARRSKAKQAGYTERQKKILRGDFAICTIRSSELVTILNKAKECGDSKIAAFIEAELKAREEKTTSDSIYNEIEQMVINTARSKASGERPLRAASISSHVRKKKSRLSEEETTLCSMVAAFRDDEYYRATKQIQNSYAYTKRQAKIIKGTIPLSDVRTAELGKLIDKAKHFGDLSEARLFEEEKEKREQLRNKPFDDNDFDISEVTGIVHGEVPYEAINLNQLRRIAARAKANKDYELMDLMDNLITDKVADAEERNRKGKPKNKLPVHKTSYTPWWKNKEWGMRVLESLEDPDMCTDSDLQDIRLLAMCQDDPVYRKVAEFLIAEREDPTIVYTAKTGAEAMDIIRSLTIQPVRLPEDW